MIGSEPAVPTLADRILGMRKRAPDVAALTLLSRMVQWRLCSLLGLHPVIRVHDACRLRMYPARQDHGIAKAVFLMRDRYEPSVRALIDATLTPNDVAMDIGANMGLWTLRMAERVGASGRVIAFEPGAAILRRLNDNIALSGMGMIDVHGVALGDSAGEMTLHTPGDSGSASLGGLDEPSVKQLVPVERLDAVWIAAGRPPVALVKIDVEGAEPMVLAGATEFFAACRPVVCCEINPAALARLGFGPQDVDRYFLQRDYRAMIWVEDAGRLERWPDCGAPGAVEDIVFMPKETRLTTPLEEAES